jgi:hypothetical protein
MEVYWVRWAGGRAGAQTTVTICEIIMFKVDEKLAAEKCKKLFWLSWSFRD